MPAQLLMTVDASVRLTGLGLLAVPRNEQSVLRQFVLHTKLLVTLTFPDGQQETMPASVEEMSRQVEAETGPTYRDIYVLLLESELIDDVPVGTEITWVGDVDDPFALLR
ncbi:hypothetical protein [Hymenobacter sp. GOD-10R]|uniref:hypothetical protein n=1 Tax=Hymenobacter sp. GOD-10R TaxID=3093922 RepID=UPI002D796A00|nr:hypothetical protein [Hymenobacter sp. GOD-10R]WRQ30865.1 hypothetical protein SD425_11390 [Hymenobacter sp. GOD-10R]